MQNNAHTFPTKIYPKRFEHQKYNQNTNIWRRTGSAYKEKENKYNKRMYVA